MEALAGAPSTGRWWIPIAEFGVHVFVGTIIFCLIAAPAVALSAMLNMRYLALTDDVIVTGVRCAEYALFCADLVLFVIFLIRSVARAARKL